MVSIWLINRAAGAQTGRKARIWLAKSKSRRSSDRRDVNLLARIVMRTGLLPILLDPGGTKPGEAVAIDRVLPGQGFIHRQGVARAGFFQRKQAGTHGGNDFGFAADHPTLRARRGKIRDRQRAAVGPDDVLHPRAMGFAHVYSHALY